MSVRGELHVNHYDRAIMEHMGAEFLRLEGDLESLPRQLRRPQRQVMIPGVKGTGREGRVLVVWDAPEDIYNRYVLPGINVKRSGGPDLDEGSRQFGWKGGHKYRVASESAELVTVETPAGPVTGATEYTLRDHPEPSIISYEIHARARDEASALKMHRFLRKSFRHHDYLVVHDTENVPSTFTMFFDGSTEISDTIDSLNSYEGWLVSIRIEAEIDLADEYTVGAVLSRPSVIAGIKE